MGAALGSRSAWRAVAVAVGLAAAMASIADADPPAPGDVVARLSSHYRAGLTCERMQIEVRSDSGRTARSWAVVRLKPGEAPAMMLELGSLRIAVDGRELVAVHDRNPHICFKAQLPGDGPLTMARLSGLMPPVPIPQFDLINAPESGPIPSLAVYARQVQWTGAETDPRSPGRVTVAGVTSDGTITMVANGDRLDSVEIREEARGTTLRLTVRPAAPCREEDLRLDVIGREVVERLSDLQPRSGVLRVGAPVPEMQLSTAGGQVQRLKDLFQPPPQWQPAPEVERLVLVMLRRQRGDPLALSRAGRVEPGVLGRELAKMHREAFSPPPPSGSPKTGGDSGILNDTGPLLPIFNFAQIAVIDAASPPSAEALLAMVSRERAVWSSPTTEHFAWTTDARSSVELFATTGESAAIIVDQNQRLRAVIVIHDRMTTEDLLDQVTAALIESAGEGP